MKRLSISLCMLVAASTAFAQSWAPSDTQKTAVLSRAEAYFTALDAQDHSTTYSMLAPSLKRSASEAVYTKLLVQNRTQHGVAASREVAGVSWYPKGSAVGTGVAAALDFSGSTEPGKIFCGYLAFIEMDADRFVLLREDTTYFSPKMVAKMNSLKRKELLDRPGCRQFMALSR